MATDDPGAMARAQISYAVAVFYSFGDYAEASALMGSAAEIVERQPAESGLASRAIAGSVIVKLLLGGGLDEDRLQRALELEDPDETVRWRPGPACSLGSATCT